MVVVTTRAAPLFVRYWQITSNSEQINYSAGKRDRGKRHPREEGGEAPRLHRTGGEAPCSMKGRKTRREENVFKGVENLPALLYTIV